MNIKKEVIIELCLLLWKNSLNSSLQYFLELIEMNAKIADQALNGDSKQERWVILIANVVKEMMMIKLLVQIRNLIL